ncbi:MAG: hypothetical protein EHM23_23365 [Acidobacteria bacterium]|nr:MAG: hypothetical protein EHM23_23365 [Acidobacteriota bacterium]
MNTATLRAIQHSFSTSPEFVDLIEFFEDQGQLLELKVEVIATEVSGNKTITEKTLFEQGGE